MKIRFLAACVPFLLISGSDGCSLEIDGQSSPSVMLTNTSKTHHLLVTGSGPCRLTFLLVGGGGHDGLNSHSGAGSGLLHYHHHLQVQPGTGINATVGGHRQASVLAVSNGETFIAEAGGDSRLENGTALGGDGFSGGGANGPYNGGAGGGDGKGKYGGGGTGEEVATYTFSAWVITPGDRGNHTANGGGGGSGGVLVDGVGPLASVYQGQGYGGGGNGFVSSETNYGDGLQGVILIETYVGLENNSVASIKPFGFRTLTLVLTFIKMFNI